jgi:hypothetical protein
MYYYLLEKLKQKHYLLISKIISKLNTKHKPATYIDSDQFFQSEKLISITIYNY